MKNIYFGLDKMGKEIWLASLTHNFEISRF